MSIFKKLLVVFFLCVIAQNGYSQLTWQNQSSGVSDFLFDCDFVNHNVGYAVGNNGRIIKTIDGGSSWNILPTTISHKLSSVFFNDENRGWVAGEGGSILRTTNGGASWDVQSLNSNILLEDVFFIDDQIGWVSGEDTLTNQGVLYKTTDGGSTWAGIPSAAGLGPIYCVDFSDENNGFVVTLLAVYRTINGGTTWSFVSGLVTTSQLNHISMYNDLIGWVTAGDGKIFYTNDGGVVWALQPTGINAFLWDIAIVDANNVFIAGHNGVVLRTDDGGSTWVQQPGGFTNLLVGIDAVDPYSAWVCGELGKVYSTTGSDLGFVSLESPQKVCDNEAIPISVRVENYGSATLNGGVFTFSDGISGVNSFIWNGILLPGAQEIVTLGNYSIDSNTTFTFTFSGDDNVTNNYFFASIERGIISEYGVNGPYKICSGEVIGLNVWGGESYKWLNATADSTAQKQELSVYKSTNFIVEINQTDCVVYDTVMVTVQDGDCGVTAFSPNGDGINDFFYIAYLPEGGNVVNIFNRWGDVLVSIPNYDNQETYWTGEDVAGQGLVEGVYYYTVETPSNGSVQAGWVKIVR